MRKYAVLFDEIERELKDHLLYESDFWPTTEERLAARFGVSRMPIRTVISRLERERLLVRRNKKGTFPNVPDEKAMLDIFDVRLMIEPELAAVAAEGVDADSLRELEALAVNCSERHAVGDRRMAATHDVGFHRLLAELSGNGRVVGILEELSIATRVRIAFSQDQIELLKRRVNPNSHERIVAKLADRDPKGARRAMFKHLDWSRRLLRKSN